MENQIPPLASQPEPQLQPELPPEPKSNNLWIIISIVIVGLAILAGAVYYYKDQLFKVQIQPGNNQNTSVNEVIDVSDETVETDRQTYTSEEYKYTVEYPLDWKYEDITEGDSLHFRKTECPVESCGFTIAVVGSDDMTINEYLKKVYDTSKVEGINFYVSTKIEINNSEGIRGLETGPGSYEYDITYLKYGDYIYQFKYALQDMKGNTDEFKNELKLIEQVLASFKFLPDTSDWQTYSDTNFGYSFMYPKDWNIDGRLISYKKIEHYEIGSNNAPISFGAYSENYDISKNNDEVMNFNRWSIDNLDRNKPDSIITINGRQFDKYDLIDNFGAYEGDYAGNVVILVSRDNLSDMEI